MRTTLTLDDDVAVLVDRVRAKTGASLRKIVNDALRRSLASSGEMAPRGRPFRTRSRDLGRLRLRSLDKVAEALALGEGKKLR